MRASQQYAKHMTNTTTTVLPSRPTTLNKYSASVILKENSFQFNGENFLQIHRTARERKWRLLSPIFSWQKSKKKRLMNAESSWVWKRYIDEVFSLWDVNRQDIDLFIEQANTFHSTMKFTAEISEEKITLLGTVVYKGERFLNEATLDVKTHYKPIETFQYTHYSSCHSASSC